MRICDKEPVISVGLLTAPKIESRTLPDGTFEIEDVAIGIGFHWERRERQRFAGSLRVIRDGDMEVAVNDIPLEEYLKSVISSEMNADASEALLKAHAVISRSWLLANIRKEEGTPAYASPQRVAAGTQEETAGKSSAGGEEELIRWYDREDHRLFDVCADDHCQRYQGLARQTNPTAAKAVGETRGEVLTFEGAICDTRFSKCCGGRAELFENCWEPVAHPYLTSVADSAGPGERDFCDTADEDVLRQVLNSYDRETPDFYRWERRYSPEELSGLLRRKTGVDFGEVRALEPLECGLSGRIIRLRVSGSRRTMVIGKELEIRRALSESHLYSSAFEASREEDGWVLRGRGWGHGVGLCQIGAAVMGALGYDYRRILAHYFPNASLTKIYE